MFKKAERKQAKLRLALCAPSGSGKTYGALLLAKGMGGKVAVVDTENSSASLYADLCDYDVLEISPDFTPEKYIDAIHGAEEAGYNVLIIDSLSHAWAGEGGILDIQAAAAKASKSGNSYTSWREVTPQHNRLVNAILQSKMHIIVTMRSKTAHEIQKDEGGKNKVVKLGMAPIQRDGMEYEFTVVLDVSVNDHIASASKDRTRLFDGKHFKITENTGKELVGWLNSGVSFEEQDAAKNKEAIAFVERISQCDSMESLKTFFATTYHYCIKKGFSEELMNRLTAAKDLRKEHFEAQLHEDIPQ